MAVKSISNLRKFRSKELKAIMKKFKIKGRSGKKEELVQAIRNNEQWSVIKQQITIPVRPKRTFSAAQIRAQEAFTKRVKGKQRTKKIVKLEAIEEVTGEKDADLLKLLQEETKEVAKFDIELEADVVDKKIKSEESLVIFEELSDKDFNDFLKVIHPADQRSTDTVEYILSLMSSKKLELQEEKVDIQLDIAILSGKQRKEFEERLRLVNKLLQLL